MSYTGSLTKEQRLGLRGLSHEAALSLVMRQIPPPAVRKRNESFPTRIPKETPRPEGEAELLRRIDERKVREKTKPESDDEYSSSDEEEVKVPASLPPKKFQFKKPAPPPEQKPAEPTPLPTKKFQFKKKSAIIVDDFFDAYAPSPRFGGDFGGFIGGVEFGISRRPDISRLLLPSEFGLFG